MDPLIIKRGRSFSQPITFYDSSGNRINIVGGTVTFSIRPTLDSSNTLSKDYTTFTNPSQGEMSITLSSSDTSAIPAGVYWADIKLVTSSFDDSTDPFLVVVKTPFS